MSKGPSKQESARQDPHGKADWDWYGSVRAYAHSGVSPDEPETPERAQPHLGFTCASVYRGGEPQFYCVSDSCIVVFVACQEAAIGTLCLFCCDFGFPGGHIPVTGPVTHIASHR